MDLAKAKVAQMSKARIEAPRLDKTAAGERGALVIQPPHADAAGWSEQVRASLGTLSSVFADRLTCELANATGKAAAEAQTAVEHGLAFVAGLQPENELEASLAAQMFAVHTATMECARRAAKAELMPQLEAHTGMMVKLSRTFTAQVEALAKLRGGGRQQVEVRHVYVDARGGQNVIAGGGVQLGNGDQPHAPAKLAHNPASGVPPLWGADTLGLSVQSACDPGAGALPDARRPEPRRAAGASERGLGGRSLQPGAGGEPEGDEGPHARLQAHAR